jgi:hypothetical protein
LLQDDEELIAESAGIATRPNGSRINARAVRIERAGAVPWVQRVNILQLVLAVSIRDGPDVVILERILWVVKVADGGSKRKVNGLRVERINEQLGRVKAGVDTIIVPWFNDMNDPSLTGRIGESKLVLEEVNEVACTVNHEVRSAPVVVCAG